MRDALARTRVSPHEKIRRIQQMVETLLNKKAIKDWNISIDQDAITMNTDVLAAPQMVTQGQIIKCDEQVMRKSSIFKPINLEFEKWIVVYEKNDRVFNVTDNIFKDLVKASA